MTELVEEPGNIIDDSPLVLDSTEIRHGWYKHNRVPAQEGSAPQTISEGGGNTFTFQVLPNQAVNFAQSYFEFNLSIAAGANNHINNVLGESPLPFVRQIDVQPEAGNSLLRLEEANKYLSLACVANMSKEDFLTMDQESSLFAPFIRTVGLNTANTLPFSYLSNATTNTVLAAADSKQSGLLEPIHVYPGLLEAGGGESAVSFKLRVPLWVIYGTVLGMNKDLYFGQSLNVILTMDQLANWCFDQTNTAATFDPTGTTAGSAIVSPTGAVTISAYLQLAIQQDESINMQLKQQVLQEKGIQLYAPCVTRIVKQTMSGTSQNLNAILTRGHGEKLLRTYYSVFGGFSGLTGAAGTGAYATTYNHAMNHFNRYLTANTGVNPQNKISVLQTIWDGITKQQNQIYCGGAGQSGNGTGGFDDWARMLPLLKGSAYSTSAMYYLMWQWIDNFASPSQPLHVQRKREYGINVEGIDLGDAPSHQYQLNTTNPGTAVNNNAHYVFAETLKLLDIKQGNIGFY